MGSAWLDTAIVAVSGINTCPKLQEFSDWAFGKSTDEASSLTAVTSAIEKVLDGPGATIDSVITWCNDLVTVMNGPLTKAIQEAAEITIQIGQLTDAITNKATTLGCSGLP